MSLKLRIYYNAVFGAIGGLIGWFILGQIVLSDNIIIQDIVSGVFIGIFIGGLIGSIDGIFDSNVPKLSRGALYGSSYGLLGGVLGLLLGELILWLLGGGILGRALGWMLLGLAVGISEGAASRAPRKMSYGALGGAIGGFLGGAIFEIFRASLGSYGFSQAIGLMILGASVGSLIGTVEDILKEAWIKVVRGWQEGKEFSIAKNVSSIGSHELCDIALFRDPKIAKRHAELRHGKNGFALNSLVEDSHTLLINGQPVTGAQALNNKDRIQIGDTVLLFHQKAARSNRGSSGAFPSLRDILKKVKIGVLAVVFFLPLILAAPVEGAYFEASLSQIDRSDFPSITVYVDVLNELGQPIKDLTKANFGITEDKRSVEFIEFVSPLVPQPMTAVLVLDRSGSMNKSGKISGLQKAASEFVQLTKESDKTSLIAFNEQIHVLQPFTSDKSTLYRKIRSIEVGGNTAYFDAIQRALELLRPVKGRKAVIALTDGMDNSSRRSITQVIEFANKIGIPVFSIGLGARASGPTQEGGIYEEPLIRIAEETGGSYFYTPTADQLVKFYKELSIRLQSGYKITYLSPRQVRDGTTRNVDVTVDYNDLIGHSSNSYYVPGVIVPASNPYLFLGLLVPLTLLIFAPQIVKKSDWPSLNISEYAQVILGKASMMGDFLSRISSPKERFYLVAESRSFSPRTVRLREGEVSIGSAPSNDIVIDWPSVDGKHALIRWDRGRYIVEDLKSKTGTFVSYSGDPAKERKISKNALKLGSSVRFGNVKFYLSDSKSTKGRGGENG